MVKWIRRLVELAIVGALSAVVAAWFRNRHEEAIGEPAPGSAAWPPLRPVAEPTDGSPADPIDSSGTDHDSTKTWIQPGDDGSCPLSHPVKANADSGIFHVPGGRAYDRTHGERCYISPEAATADGYRASKI